MKRSILTICLCLFLTSSITHADWFDGDDYKMHFPQLPDPFGWDIKDGYDQETQRTKVLADDWLCTETGPVGDVHLWGSWKDDIVGQINSIHLSIHSDVPAGTDPATQYSHPGELLWQHDFSATEFIMLDPYGTGQEGWYNPNSGEVLPDNHFTFHQINITNIPDPFIQKEGTIYWLDVVVNVPSIPGTVQPEWGWKTSIEQFNDDAVWGDLLADGTVEFWNELTDPLADPVRSLDLAFVITPEPTTMALLSLGSLILLRRKGK